MKIVATQEKSELCRLPQALLHHVAHAGDEHAIGRFAFVGAEVPVQNFPVTSGPGAIRQVPDGTQEISFIGALVA